MYFLMGFCIFYQARNAWAQPLQKYLQSTVNGFLTKEVNGAH
jgi:hypothetical protein